MKKNEMSICQFYDDTRTNKRVQKILHKLYESEHNNTNIKSPTIFYVNNFSPNIFIASVINFGTYKYTNRVNAYCIYIAYV